MFEKIRPELLSFSAQENNRLRFFWINQNLVSTTQQAADMRLFFLTTLDLTLAVVVATVKLLSLVITTLEAGPCQATGEVLTHGMTLAEYQAVQSLVTDLTRVFKTSAVRANKIIVGSNFENILWGFSRSKLETNLVSYLTFIFF